MRTLLAILVIAIAGVRLPRVRCRNSNRRGQAAALLMAGRRPDPIAWPGPNAGDAIPKPSRGSCPWGWIASGSYLRSGSG